jgi:hypothetical protein
MISADSDRGEGVSGWPVNWRRVVDAVLMSCLLVMSVVEQRGGASPGAADATVMGGYTLPLPA